NESDLPPIPDSSVEAGILPREIAKLVHTRRDIKNEMKRLNDKNCERYKQCDIRQLGLKLTANSMYGCLGFEGSRFCAKTLAAMITSKGREILESTRNLVESKGYSVIYGDTDSIMVNTNSINLAEAKQIGYTIKALINKSYKQLTLDIDGVYKRLLLLKKKKYAGLAIDLSNGLKVSKELKGLDIVRRDWSFLAREVGDKVVDIILQSNGRDEMVEEIRKTLSDVKEGIEKRIIPLEKFEILKKLTHRPEDYRDAKSQPHVLVALRLNQTKNANLRQNDIVKYIICDDGSGQAATQRAYARIEIETNNELKIDSSYYLAHQIHPVVSRLCEPIEEMDACQVAEALGLDGTHYRRRLIEQVDDDANDENCAPGIIFNFNACDGLPIQCPSCKHIDIHRSPIFDNKKPSLAECSSCHFNILSDPIKVELQIIDFLQKNCKKYSECKYICDDVVCGFELDFPPVFKNEFGFPCTECSHGFFKPSYTLKRLFDQQNFVLKIVYFDEWELKEATKEQKDTVNAYSKIVNYRSYSKDWTKRVLKFINENPYNRVDLSLVFAPMKIL
uniref:DNA-directed DNA polymerase n=1 Tax=Panagrolaimus sp. ES5 TaxID=591445 RepID=A0AC34G5U2_9BILA